MDNHFKVACSVVVLLMFFHDPDFHGKTSTVGTFNDSDKHRPIHLSDI
jgi:hypothetical protein